MIQEARARVEAERAKTELWYAEAITKATDQKQLDEILFGYVFHIFCANAEELFNTGLELNWPVATVRERINRALNSVVNEAFASKHPYGRIVGSDWFKAGFRQSTIDEIHSSEEWLRIQESLKVLAESQAQKGTTNAVPEETSKSKPTRRRGFPANLCLDSGTIAKQARAATVAKLIDELNTLGPQMFEDEPEYNRLRDQYSDFLTFKITDGRPDLKLKVLAIRASVQHIRLAQELAAAHHGRKLNTIRDDWKRHKPSHFRRQK